MRLVSISAIQVVNSHNRVLLRIAPNAFPCSRVTARREPGDEGLVEFVQVGGNSGGGCGCGGASAVVVAVVVMMVIRGDAK